MLTSQNLSARGVDLAPAQMMSTATYSRRAPGGGGTFSATYTLNRVTYKIPTHENLISVNAILSNDWLNLTLFYNDLQVAGAPIPPRKTDEIAFTNGRLSGTTWIIRTITENLSQSSYQCMVQLAR